MKSRHLLLFNLEMSDESRLLQSNIAMVRAFKEIYKEVTVVTTHLGSIPNDLKNVRVVELGGGSLWHRLRALMRLSRISVSIISNTKNLHVFHHMSHRTAVFPGILFKIIGIPQVLWYSHAAHSISLLVALKIVDNVVTPSEHSFPFSDRKVIFVGQAIDMERIETVLTRRRFSAKPVILSVGRVSRAKHLERLANSLVLSPIREIKKVVLVGETRDSKYLNELELLFEAANVELETPGSVSPRKVPQILSQHWLYFTGTPAGVDRAAVEAAAAGCLVVSENKGLLELCGMSDFWSSKNGKSIPSITSQISSILNLDVTQRMNLSQQVSLTTRSKNDVRHTTRKISKILLECNSN